MIIKLTKEIFTTCHGIYTFHPKYRAIHLTCKLWWNVTYSMQSISKNTTKLIVCLNTDMQRGVCQQQIKTPVSTRPNLRKLFVHDHDGLSHNTRSSGKKNRQNNSMEMHSHFHKLTRTVVSCYRKCTELLPLLFFWFCGQFSTRSSGTA